MPTYDYECTMCGYRFEVFHDMNSTLTKRCPKCRGKAKKLISGGSGLIFKGPGFYITDYKKKSSKNDTAVESKEKSLTNNTQSKTQSAQKSSTPKQEKKS